MNTERTIDDDMLSAYLDGELPAQDLHAVRTALAKDPALAERLAALRSVNDLVVRHARALDATPLPSRVLDLLQTDTARPGAIVVQGPWQHWTQRGGARMALAAGLVLALVLTSNYLTDPAPAELPQLAAYSAYLDASPSGETVDMDGATLVNRFTFRDQQNRYCRQYQLETAAAASENIACRAADGWSIVAAIPVASSMGSGYQPASASTELNALLDSMMQSTALDLAAEASLMENGWQDE